MNFLQPGWLWGLLALAIPVIVHLFNFRKTRRIYFSNTRFIKKVQEASKSRRKLKHYLVLFTRLMFIFFLVMAFAQPFLPASEGSLNEEQVYFYLDNSYSMSRSSGEQITALEEGIEYIESLVNLYPAGTDFYLLTNDFAPFSHAPHSSSQLQELLTEINLTGIIRSTDEIFSRWQSQRQMNGGGDYYYISDMQESTFGLEKLDKVDSTVSVNLVPVTAQNNANVYIDTVYLDNPFLIGKENVRLNVGIKNSSDQPAEELAVSVFLGDIQTGSTTIDIGASEREIVVFDLVVNNRESLQGRVSIEEYPVTFDNDLFFVLDLGETIDVLEIKGDNASVVLSNVFGNQDLFNYKGYNYSNLDYNMINSADLVLLNGLNNLDPALTIAIQNYMQNGGDVALIPSSSGDINSYRNIYGGISAADSVGKIQLRAPDFNNPFFTQVFEERDPAINMPAAIPVIKWAGGSDILNFSTGNPFLSVINEQLFIFSSPFTDSYNEMHKHALFVPVMYKLAALSTDQERPLYHYLDERTLSFNVDTLSSNQIFKLVKNEEEIIPSQRVVNQRLFLQLPAYLVNTGYYKLIENARTYETIAFNVDKKESLLRTLTAEEIAGLAEIFPALNIYNVENADEFTKTLVGEYVGFSFWKYCLIAAILFLLAEILIIRFVP